MDYSIGQRVSYASALCTVRYQGPVSGTKGDWLGVEWDDPSRGKHDGERDGVRYFRCKSKHPTAASFLRPSRPADRPMTFLEALNQKYAYQDTPQDQDPIVWGGKTVEEVGFEKIRQQLAQLHALKIVLLDGMVIAEPDFRDAKAIVSRIREVCPQVQELDLSRNEFESWHEIVGICQQLHLRSLKVNGNRLINSDCLPGRQGPFSNVAHLGMENILTPWKDICRLTTMFPNLKSLSASSNEFSRLSSFTPVETVIKLSLESNDFCSLGALAALTKLHRLESLHLRDNPITSCLDPSSKSELPVFSSSLSHVDLSYNAISSWSFIDQLPQIFPGMTSLRVSHNPLYESATDGDHRLGIDEGYMLTVARIGQLQKLNYSSISLQERRNAEMYYLSRIAKAAAELPEQEEAAYLSQHPRYHELCQMYGAPIIARATSAAINPRSLEARLIQFTLKESGTPSRTMTTYIPREFDTYRLKGLVGRLFDLKPLHIRLIWETGEWDPVAGFDGEPDLDDDDDDDDDDIIDDDENVEMLVTEREALPDARGKDDGRWVKREVDIVDGTREVGYWIEGREAIVRIEPR